MLFLLVSTISLADNFISIGTNSIPVSFEDTELPVSVQSLICNDLSKYFAYSKDISSLFHIQETTNKHRLHSIVNSKHAKGIMGNVYLSRTEGMQTVYVKRKLTNTYTNILQTVPNLNNLVSNATDFISVFNSCQITNYSPDAKCALFRSLESPEIPSATNDIVEGIESSWIKEKYSLPAIIDYNSMIVWTNYPQIPIFTIRSFTEESKSIPEASTQYIGCISNKWFFIAY